MAHSSRRASSYKVKITKVDHVAPFIRITAQNLNDASFTQLNDGLARIYEAAKPLRDEELNLGETYIAKVNDSFQRSRILDSDDFSSIALVDFIDLGHHGKVKYSDLRAFSGNSCEIRSLPSISKEFILAQLITTRNDSVKIKRLADLIINKTAVMTIVGQNDFGKFVDLRFAESSLAREIVLKHPVLNTIFEYITLEDQVKLMTEKEPQSRASVHAPPKRAADIVERPLPVQFFSPDGIEIIISACDKGPREFFVQLVESLQKIQHFNIKLRSQKQNFKPVPNAKPGDVLIAVYDHENVDRALILETMARCLCVVRFIDTGNKRILNFSQICELPDELRIDPFAWKFALSGTEELRHLRPSEQNFYFSYLTREKKLTLKLEKHAENKDDCNVCSLYDGDTNILNLLKNYKPRALCYAPQEALQIGSSFNARISSFETPMLFYINMLDNEAAALRLNAELEIFQSCNLVEPEKDNLCCVLVKGKYYRGQVVKRLSPYNITCQLVDLGLIDDYSSNEVKLTVDKFARQPPLAYKCCLYGLDLAKVNDDVAKGFKDACKQSQFFTVTVKEFKDGFYHVVLETADKKNVLDEIFKSSSSPRAAAAAILSTSRNVSIQRQKHNSFRINPPNRMTEPLNLVDHDWTEAESTFSSAHNSWSSLGTNNDESPEDNAAIITSVESPTDFYIQLSSSLPALEKFLNELQTLSETLDPLVVFQNTEMCITQNPLTHKWCRAIICETEFGSFGCEIKLRNVDDGSVFSIYDAAKLKKYPFSCLATLSFGIRCALPVCVNAENVFEAQEFMCHFIGKDMKYRIICASELINIVDITVNPKKNLVQELVKAELATSLKYFISGIGEVAHIEDLSHFYIKLDSKIGGFDVMNIYGSRYEKTPLVKPPKSNDVVMAINGITKQWARAKILSIATNELKVKFLDHGSVETVDVRDVGEITPQFTELEPLVHCCYLTGLVLSSKDPATPAAVARFQEMTKDAKFYFKIMSPTHNRSSVQVLSLTGNESKSINEELIALCENEKESCKTQSNNSSILQDD